MPSILEQNPFPWTDPTAQQLHTTLTRVYPTSPAALHVAKTAGIETDYVNAAQASVFLWHDLLDLAAQGSLGVVLVRTVRDQMSPQNPQRAFLDSLLADTP